MGTYSNKNSRKLTLKLLSLITICGLLLTSTISAPSLLGNAATAAEKPTADLVTNFLNVPKNANYGENFTYQVKVENLGPHPVENALVNFDFDSSQAIEITCTAQNGAVCAPGLQAVQQTIPSLPPTSFVLFTISGRFPAQSSTTHSVNSTLPESMKELDPASNSVQQQIALYKNQISVTKIQNKEIVASGEPRAYTITYQNTGTIPVTVNLKDEYSSSLAASKTITWNATCGTNTSGINCPREFNGETQQTSLTGIPLYGNNNFSEINLYSINNLVMPPNSTIEVLVNLTENFECILDYDATLVSNTAKITPLADNIDINAPVVKGKVTGTQCPKPQLSISKTQDKSVVSGGETRTYTITYQNTGTIPVTVDISDSYATGRTANKTVKWSATCGQGTQNMPCPAFLDGLEHTRRVTGMSYWGNNNRVGIQLFQGNSVEIPVGATLEIVTPVVEEFECLINTDHTNVENTAQFRAQSTGSLEATSVSGTINGQICPAPQLEVTKEADKEIVYSGETRNYTITYKNVGTVDVTVDLSDDYSSSRAATKNIRWSASCGKNTTGMECPAFLNGTEKTGELEGLPDYGNNNYNSFTLYSGSDVLIPAGATLEILVPVVETITCTLTTQNSLVNNTASYFYRRYSLDKRSNQVNGEVHHKCGTVDVSTSVFAKIGGKIVESDETVKVSASDTVPLVARLENSLGTATNVPLTVQLPNILDAAPDVEITCTSSENVTCPVFTYDPATKQVTGTVKSIPRGEYLEIEFPTTVNKTGSKHASAKVQVTAPAKGDVNPEEDTLNPSSLTLGYTPTEIPIPPTPGVHPVCAADGSPLWDVPEDSETVSWEVTADGHLVVTAGETSVFRAPESNSLVDSHDYGTTKENNKTCLMEIPVPPKPLVDDPCGTDNATWQIPEDTEKVSWNLTVDKDLIVSAKPGFIFPEGRHSKDFGKAEETNTAACEPDTPASAPTPPVPSPMPPVPTEPAPVPPASAPTPIPPADPAPESPTEPKPVPAPPTPTPAVPENPTESKPVPKDPEKPINPQVPPVVPPVTPPGVPTAPDTPANPMVSTPQAKPELPNTGSQAGGLLSLALAMLVTGLSAVFIRKRSKL